jgi:hypothetical protein
MNRLPPELISLVHHIELNKAGWWEKSIQRCVIAAIWLSGKAVAQMELGEELRVRFSMSVAEAAIAEQVEVLVGLGTLFRLAEEKLKLSEHALLEFERDIKEAEQLEDRAKSKFEALFAESCPGLDRSRAWQDFNERLLVPLIRGVGARTYELISGSGNVSDKTPGLGEFLAYYPEETHVHLRSALLSFLDPKDAIVRSYVLRQLNAYFFVEAGSLDVKTLTSIAKASERAPSFAVFLDTNFLFSMLELHENPSNESARCLMKLLVDLGNKISCKLYVFPNTLEEIKGVIAYHRDILQGLELKPNLAEAALDAGLTGVARKFVETTRKAGGSIKSADYFAPYLTDLVPILRKRNIDFFNQKVDGYTTRQDVVDDLLGQLEFEKRFGRKAKNYEQLEHDMVLWHFVADKRPAHIETPLEAKYWIVTVDYHFLGFDSFKRKNSAGQIPVCLHPTALIQMLQFWVPRSTEFEEAVLGSLRWPFLFQEFDVGAERMTIRILEVLSRFENADDLPKDVLTSILINDALRQKLSVERSVERQVDLVREALIEENEKVRAQLQSEREERERLNRDFASKSQQVETLERVSDERKSLLSETQRNLEDSEKQRRNLEERLGHIEKEIAVERASATRRGQIRSFGLISLCLLLFLEASFTALAYLTRWHWGFWRTNTISWSIGFGLWLWLVDSLAQRHPAVIEWAPYVRLHQLRKWIYGGLIGEVIGHAVWEYLKRLS